MSLVYPPFLLEDRTNPELLSAGVPGSSGGEKQDVILERDGVHYIDRGAMTPDKKTIKNLDQDFLRLVDSVLK
jgi:hypothetical protein